MVSFAGERRATAIFDDARNKKHASAAHLNLENCNLDDVSVDGALRLLKRADQLHSVSKLTLDSNQLTKVPIEAFGLECVCRTCLDARARVRLC